MSYEEIADKLLQEDGVEISTMMKTPCLRYRGDFMAMMSERLKALIVKPAPERVDELIAAGIGHEFNFTKKRFKEWGLIPPEHECDYETYIRESLAYAKSRSKA